MDVEVFDDLMSNYKNVKITVFLWLNRFIDLLKSFKNRYLKDGLKSNFRSSWRVQQCEMRTNVTVQSEGNNDRFCTF